MAKYSYVISNQRTGIKRQLILNNPYYYAGDIIKFEGKLWTIISRNF